MRIYLIRHAAAFDRDRKRWPDDGQRPLTPEGINVNTLTSERLTDLGAGATFYSTLVEVVKA